MTEVRGSSHLRELSDQELWERHWHEKRNWHEPSHDPFTELRRRFEDRLNPDESWQYALHECFTALWVLALGYERAKGIFKDPVDAPTRSALKFFCVEKQWLSSCADGPCKFDEGDVWECIESLAKKSFERPVRPNIDYLPDIPDLRDPEPKAHGDAGIAARRRTALESRVRLICDMLGTDRAKMWAASRHMSRHRRELSVEQVYDQLVDMATRGECGPDMAKEYKEVIQDRGKEKARKKVVNAVRYSDFKVGKHVLKNFGSAIDKALDSEEYEVFMLRYGARRAPRSWQAVLGSWAGESR